MTKKDSLKEAVSSFHNIYSAPEPTHEEQFKRTMTFNFDYRNHAYLRAIADVYNVPLTAVGTEFFESSIPTIVGLLPEPWRSEVQEKADLLCEEFLEQRTGIREANQMDIQKMIEERQQ